MGEALYRKHRPKKLSDVVGQPHITDTLTNAIKSNRISHGYLFSGPRGVGKTSVARILAYQVNDYEYGNPNGLLDIIEIDGASNRRIDEIRDLREKIHIAPVASKYKVYIIDEVHMLTKEAFNALLKTLEEPPVHVIFILATTELHKLPDTIVSRTQSFTFKAVPLNKVTDHLEELAKIENIKINKEGLKLIAEHGEGSFRDSISILDQLSSHKNVSTDAIRALLGLPPKSLLDSISHSLAENDLVSLSQLLENSRISGVSPDKIAHQLIDSLKSNKDSLTKSSLDLCLKLLDINYSKEPNRLLELILFDHILSHQTPASTQTVSSLIRSKSTERAPINIINKETSPPTNDNLRTEDNTTESSMLNSKNTNEIYAKNKSEKATKPTLQANTKDVSKNSEANADIKSDSSTSTESEPKPAPETGDIKVSSLDGESLWQKVLDNIRSKHNTLYGIARMVDPKLIDNKLILSVPYAFHAKRLGEDKNSKIIRKIVTEYAGQPIDILVESTKKQGVKPEPHKESVDFKENLNETSVAPLESITQIFGGGEILEN